MVHLKEIIQKCMPKEKREWERIDIFTYYLERPLSFPITWLCVNLKISANAVSFLSIIAALASTFLTFFACGNFTLIIVGWALLFLWSILDCVDGNIARFNNTQSFRGELWDATAGYVALCCLFVNGFIIAAAENPRVVISFVYSDLYLFFAIISVLLCLLPRLLMHKKEAKVPEASKGFTHISKPTLFNYIVRNVLSITGLPLFLLLFAIAFNFANLFSLVYFVFNFIICIFSCIKILMK